MITDSTMPIKHLVEIGRVAYIGYGRNVGKPVVIVDVIDHNRALIDGPCSKVARQPIRFKRLRLTKHKLNIDHSAPTRVVKREWEKDEITKKWKDGFQFKKQLADKRRKDLSDLGRFKVYKLKQKLNKIVTAKVAEIQSKEKREKRKKSGKVRPKKDKKPKAPAEKKVAAAGKAAKKAPVQKKT